ncbi:MAG: NTP transferase domain-containing protein [Clostridiales bacterium]|nr:NTP transferase domain-containing protein [Clostridiales bacterium]
MKAILLAGGEGTRLRPVTAGLPKPMVPLFGRPVLEHLLLLLRRHNITRAAIALGYLPQVIRDYFGDGSAWGMELTYFTENLPRGTAGAVRACEPFLEGEDCIVLSGDCVCDFDLTDCIRRHRDRQADVTLLLQRREEPLAFGLVQTDDTGRILRFLEKPGWSQVFTDQVNTGIYLLRHRVLERIPPHAACDFSRDLFPRLLEEGCHLYGDLPAGYWQDMGTCQTYLQTLRDGLESRVQLELGLPRQSPCLYAAQPIPPDVTVLPPCWIGPDVRLGRHCLIGPNTVLESGSQVGEGAVIRGSVLLGSRVGDRCTVNHAVLCQGAQTGAEATLDPLSVLGADVTVGDNALVEEGVRVWPRLVVPAGSRLRSSLNAPMRERTLAFEEDGQLSGLPGRELTPELLLRLGGLLAAEGKCGLGWEADGALRPLAMAAQAGMLSGGGEVSLLEAPLPAPAAWMAGELGLSATLFLQRQGERVALSLFGPSGLPLTPAQRRRLETELPGREPLPSDGEGAGQLQTAKISLEDYVNCTTSWAKPPISRLSVSVARRDDPSGLLAGCLEQLGVDVIRERRPGDISLRLSGDGRGLTLRTEEGRLLGPEQGLLLSCLVLLEQGERTLALSPAAPSVVDRLAETFGAGVLRLGRDGAEAERQAWRLLPLRDGCAAACLVLGHLARTGQSLTRLAARLPRFALRTREIPLETGRGRAMDGLTRDFPHAESSGEGVHIPVGEGSVWVAPVSGRSALSLRAEGPSDEFAAELCDFITEKAKQQKHL